MHFAPQQQRAQHRHQRYRDHGCARHRRRLGESQWSKQFAFLARQREHRYERQQNNGHRKEDGTAHQLGRRQHSLPHGVPVARINACLLNVPEGVFRDHNARIHQHANSDGDPRQRHNIRRDIQVIQNQK